jgi:hypothetical protein
VNRKIDVAFTQFNKEYKREVAQVDKFHDEAAFQNSLAASEARLKQALDKQAARIPGGGQALSTTLNKRVDSLIHDLSTNTTQPSTNLVRSDQSGAHADVAGYVHDEVAKGDFSLR